MAAFSLTMAILVGGIVYDFGFWFVTKSELQNVADSTAMAAGRALGAIYAGGQVDNGTQLVNLPRKLFADQQAFNFQQADSDLIQNAAFNVAGQNQAGGVAISLNPNDITVGNWDIFTNTFVPIAIGTTAPPQPNAVQVVARRDQSQNGPLAAVFGQLVNLTGYNITATSTAALTPLQFIPPATPNPPGTLSPGELILPLGVDQAHFIMREPNFCVAEIQVPSDDFDQPCHAWTTFKNPATDENFQEIVNGNQTSPDTKARSIGMAGDAYFFGGFGAEKEAELQNIFNANLPPGFTSWETLLPVYANAGCVPPGGEQIPIVAFISALITQATDFPNPLVISFQCNVVGIGRSGEVNDPNLVYGTFGSVPVLVQ